MMLRGAKAILRYLEGTHGVPLCRDSLWRLSRSKGMKRFPLRRAVLRFQLRLTADTHEIDRWVQTNKRAGPEPTSSTLSDHGPELPPLL